MRKTVRDLVVLGAGGLAREIAVLIQDINRVSPRWRVLGFVEKDREHVGKPIAKYSVLCSENELYDMEVAVAFGIGNPRTVQKVAKDLRERPNLQFPNLIHPSVIWDEDRISLGVGNVICAGNILTTDARFGSFNCLNPNSTFGHDVSVEDCCVFNFGVNVAGGVQIDSGCLVGTGATILQYLSVGPNATIGAGAVVTRNVAGGKTVVGIPARPIRHRKNGE